MNPDQELNPPQAADVARRLLVLKPMIMLADISIPREVLDGLMENWTLEQKVEFENEAEQLRNTAWEPIRQANLMQYLTPTEKLFAQTTMVTLTHQQQVDASWRVEAAQVLMWALGMLPELPTYDQSADHEILENIPSAGLEEFWQTASLRSPEEIAQARETAELWHWRSRTRQMIEEGIPFPDDKNLRKAGLQSFDDIVRFTAPKAVETGSLVETIDDDFPVFGKAYRDLSEEEWSTVRSITLERHFALNWLCGMAPGNQWDETPTDT